MRQSIQNRIHEIDKFFELNFDKPYVFNFENGRIKLKKLLMYEPEIITKIADDNINNNNKCVVFGIEDQIKDEKEEIDYKEDNLLTNKNKITNIYENDNDMNNEKAKKKRINEFKSKIMNLTERKNLNNFNNNVKVNNNNNNYNNRSKNLNNRNNVLNIPNIFYSTQSSYNNKANKVIEHEFKNKKNINNKKNYPDKLQFPKNRNNNIKINNDYRNDNPNKNNLKKNNDNNSYLSKYLINSKNNLRNNYKSKLNNQISNENENNFKKKNNNKENNKILDNNNKEIYDNDDDFDYLQNEIIKINKRPENLEMKKKYYRNPFYDSLTQNNMQVKEIKLKFILTKEEYTLLMREKARFNNPLNS